MDDQVAQPDGLLDYGQRLDGDRQWAMDEGDRYFREDNSTFKALRKVVARLESAGIPYAISGCLAMYAHGFRRFTEVVEILMTPGGLATLQETLNGHGYRAPIGGGRCLLDVETGVKIKFLLAGDVFGSHQSKTAVFPEPSEVTVRWKEISVLSLHTLLELKLVSGMTGRVTTVRDLADVVELISTLDLPRGLADSLNPDVQECYLELWDGLWQSPAGPSA